MSDTGEYVMKLAKLWPGLLLAALCFVPMQASAAPAYGCSLAEIFECTPVAGCQRVSAQQAALPMSSALMIVRDGLLIYRYVQPAPPCRV
jgi:hypothetical protein